MPLSQMKRKYRVTDGDLITISNRVLNAANRDITEMSAYGIDAAKLADVEAMISDFMDLPTDPELSGLMQEKTAEKNNLRKEATRHVLKEIMQRVEMEFGLNSPTYARFKVGKIHNASDGDFLRMLGRIFRLSGELQSDLAGRGLTEPMILAIEDYENGFHQALKDQDKAIDDRDQAVETRITQGNAVYEELVTIADLGKRLWADESEAKYNDYVLYATTPAAETAMEGEVPANGGITNVSITGHDANTNITLENTGTVPLTFYFAAQPVDAPLSGATTVDVAAGQEWTGTAAELGYSSGSKEYLNVLNENTDVGTYLVSTD